jgi:hypothetical protein
MDDEEQPAKCPDCTHRKAQHHTPGNLVNGASCQMCECMNQFPWPVAML